MFWFILGEFTSFLKQTNKTWSSAAQMIEKNPLCRIQNPGCHRFFFFHGNALSQPRVGRASRGPWLTFLIYIILSWKFLFRLVRRQSWWLMSPMPCTRKGVAPRKGCRLSMYVWKILLPFALCRQIFLINVWNQVILIMARCVRRWGIFSMVMRKLYKVAAGMTEEERCKYVIL